MPSFLKLAKDINSTPIQLKTNTVICVKSSILTSRAKPTSSEVNIPGSVGEVARWAANRGTCAL